MRQTLFYIPREIGGWPVFEGFSVMLVVFLVIAGITLFFRYREYGWTGSLAVSGIAVAIGAVVLSTVAGRVLERLHVLEQQGLPVRGYGVMLLLAVAVAGGMALYRCWQLGIHQDVLFSLAFAMFVLGILGARALYVIQYWDEKFRKPTFGETITEVLNVTQGGLVVYGSLIGAGIALVWFIKKHELPGLALCDVIAPSLVIGQGLGRLGCFMNGCCYGSLCTLPWAVTFPFGSPPHLDQVFTGQQYVHGVKITTEEALPRIVAVQPGSPAEEAGLKPGDVINAVQFADLRPIDIENATSAVGALIQAGTLKAGNPIELTIYTNGEPHHMRINPDTERSLQVHPTQLYSALNGLLIGTFLWFYFPYRRRDGEVLAVLFTIFPLTRFLMEIIRTDEPQNFLGSLTISQTISLALFGGALYLWTYLRRNPQQKLVDHDVWTAVNRHWLATH